MIFYHVLWLPSRVFQRITNGTGLHGKLEAAIARERKMTKGCRDTIMWDLGDRKSYQRATLDGVITVICT
jgi:hypothetical protein